MFAFGQTASGKTHSMLGASADAASPDAGVVPRALAALFAASGAAAQTVRITMLEVYNDAVRDLLAPTSGAAPPKLAIRHVGGGARAAPATELEARTEAEAAAALARGAAARRCGATAANAASSRSHLLIGLELPASRGRLWLVDLAGSERAPGAQQPPPLAASHSAPQLSYEDGSSGASGGRVSQSREGGCINRSLCALVDCVAALARRAPHVPWRNSKLTELLSECLGGAAGAGGGAAVLLAHVSPCAADAAETGATPKAASAASDSAASDRAAARITRPPAAARESRVRRSIAADPRDRQLPSIRSGAPHGCSRFSSDAEHKRSTACAR